MTRTDDRFDAVVVGAGASGLWAAIELARDREVLVLEADSVGAGASGAAAGFVSAFEDWAQYPKAVAHAVDRFRWLNGRHGFEFHDRPYVQLAEDAAAGETLRESFGPLIRRMGYDISYLQAEAVLDRWPGVLAFDEFHGALVNEESGIVDAGAYVESLAALASDRGVEIRTDTPVESVRVDGDAVTGVVTESGAVAAETVVCAAGAGSADLVVPFVDCPLRRFVYCNVHVERNGEIPDDHPMLYGDDLWWRPEPDRPSTLLVSGGTYFVPEGGHPPEEPPAEYLDEIKTWLPRMAVDVGPDGVVEGSFETCSGGSTITPDALPILDAPTEAPDGLVVAAGVTAGISMSPFTGAAVRSLVTGDPAPVPLDPFRADRFDSPGTSFRVHDIREPP